MEFWNKAYRPYLLLLVLLLLVNLLVFWGAGPLKQSLAPPAVIAEPNTVVSAQ